MNEIKWIVFDLGKVVVDIDVDNPIKYLSKLSNISPDIIKAAFQADFHLSDDGGLKQGIYERLQIGKINEDEFLAHLTEKLGKDFSAEELITAIMSVIKTERQDTLELIRDLSKEYQLACYSNTHEIHWNRSLVNLKSFEFFQKKMASHLSGYAKPEDKAYQYIIQQTKVPAAKILFVDDIDVNVTAAQRNGMQGVQFNQADDVRGYLRGIGKNS